MIAGLIILGVLVLLFLWAMGIYNQLVRLRNQFQNSFSQIEVQLKRRYDLIPRLVDCVKGIMGHEKDFFTEVVETRNSAMTALQSAAANPGDAQRIQQLAGAESALGGALGRLFALSEDYPEMKSNENMLQMQKDFRTTEDKISFSRQAFNDAVTSYNTYKQTFPPVLFAATFGHARDASLLDFDDDEIQEPPDVSFT